MNQYVTGATVKKLRESKGLTQSGLAELLSVSDKAVSKWETGKGYPDITLIEPLSKALNISVMELMSGKPTINQNRSSNMMRIGLYGCPVCGNVISSIGEAVISCCGITLPPLEAEAPDANHAISVERVEDEYFVSLPHDMTKQHCISFIASAAHDAFQIVKLYPESDAQARFKIGKTRCLYYYCNKHGLFKTKV